MPLLQELKLSSCEIDIQKLQRLVKEKDALLEVFPSLTTFRLHSRDVDIQHSGDGPKCFKDVLLTSWGMKVDNYPSLVNYLKCECCKSCRSIS